MNMPEHKRRDLLHEPIKAKHNQSHPMMIELAVIGDHIQVSDLVTGSGKAMA